MVVSCEYKFPGRKITMFPNLWYKIGCVLKNGVKANCRIRAEKWRIRAIQIRKFKIKGQNFRKMVQNNREFFGFFFLCQKDLENHFVELANKFEAANILNDAMKVR